MWGILNVTYWENIMETSIAAKTQGIRRMGGLKERCIVSSCGRMGRYNGMGGES